MPIQTLQQAMAQGAKRAGKQTFAEDILMRSIKVVDIGFLTVIYVILAITCAKISDAIFGDFNEENEKNKSLVTLSLEMVLILWMYGVLIYLIRNIVPLIPFPLNGFQGFDHLRVKEVSNPTVFSLVFLLYNHYLLNKIKYYYKRLSYEHDQEKEKKE